MVDVYGNWHEEKDYTNYPKSKMCDYDHMAVWIRKQGYEPKTTMENLITVIFLMFEIALEEDSWISESEDYISACIDYVMGCGGLEEFDFCS